MKEGGLVHKMSLAVAPRLIAWLIRIWFLTCRIAEHDAGNRERCREHDNPVIVTFWHYAILYPFYHLRRESAVVMVSASRDGEYIARLAARFGFGSVRGSQNRRGFQALKESMKHLAEGRHVAIVADGSQGPALKVQGGSIFLASKSRSPILPITWSATRYWTIRSWDRMVIPKPFSRIDFFYGRPVFVPAEVKADGIEQYRLQLEKNLNEIYAKAWDLHGKQEH
jgi:lysophospholipid acyltransferase (LPLAT)-like uncharacterized protein